MKMKVLCGLFLIVLIVTYSKASNAAEFIPEAESPESLNARSFEERDCQKDTHEGQFVCMALFWRYKWNDKDQKCVIAVYGGCKATKNNFKTKEECEEIAAPICRKNL